MQWRCAEYLVSRWYTVFMSEVSEIPCGGCGRALRVIPEHAGKMARCPVCGHITQIPTSMGTSIASNPLPASGQPEETEVSTLAPAPTTGLSSPPFSIHSDTAEWYMKTPEEQTFGPASFGDLERWVQEGRITSDCHLCQGAAGNWQPADWLFPSLKAQPTFHPVLTPPTPTANFSQATPAANHYPPPGVNPHPAAGGFAAGRYVAPHRGALILVLGLMGLFIQCPIFPFMTWVMGSNDLREMQSGRMDPAGRDLTRTGMIIGMILSLLWIVGFLFFFVVVLVGMAGS